MAKNFVTESVMKEQLVQKPKRKSFVDLEGRSVGKLIVGGWAGIQGKYNFWWCQCSCDNNRWFKVQSTSLQTGVTTSCGCAYARNGGKTKKDADWFQGRLQGWTLIGEYKGFNFPVQISCDLCGNVQTIPKALNALNRSCSCFNKADKKRDKVFKSCGFRLLGKVILDNNQDKKYLCECINCKLQKYATTNEIRRCPCHLGIEDPCAVYVLTSPTKDFIKIGKAINPEVRLHDINKSGAVDFQIAHIEWVSGEHCAYVLESFLHSKYGGKDYSFRPGFSGDTEVFHTTLKSVQDVLGEIAFSLTMLRKGVVPPDLKKERRIPEMSEWSFEFDGYWYPYISDLWSRCGYKRIPMNTEETLATFSTHAEIFEWSKRGLWTKYGMSYTEYFAKINHLGISDATVKDRLRCKGWTFEKAISTPIQRVKNVLYKEERMTVAAFFRLHGIPERSANSYKCKLELPPKEAIIKTAEHFGINILPSDLEIYVKQN